MKVGRIVENINPPVLGGAIINIEDNHPGEFLLVDKTGTSIIKKVDINIINALDQRDCIVWDSVYLKNKALQLIHENDMLPPSFESGPDLTYLNMKPTERVFSPDEKLYKIVMPIVSFILVFVLITFIIALSSLGKTDVIEIFLNYGIFIMLASLVSSAGISYFALWYKK